MKNTDNANFPLVVDPMHPLLALSLARIDSLPAGLATFTSLPIAWICSKSIVKFYSEFGNVAVSVYQVILLQI